MEPAATDLTTRRMTVSCLMVTMTSRLAFVRRSIADYCRQTWPAKDLVLAISGEESLVEALREHVASLGRDDIRVLTLPAACSLGEARNFSLEAATGDIICQWDDDDLHHPQLLERQLFVLTEGDFEAVYLQEVMHYFVEAKNLYWTNWRATEAAGMPGTLMARRNVPIHYPTKGAQAHLGEDSEVARALIARGRVGYLAGMPHLYIYVSHGANSWHDGHHRMLADTLSISRALLLRREVGIREGLAECGFPGGISMMGSNGPAFRL